MADGFVYGTVGIRSESRRFLCVEKAMAWAKQEAARTKDEVFVGATRSVNGVDEAWSVAVVGGYNPRTCVEKTAVVCDLPAVIPDGYVPGDL